MDKFEQMQQLSLLHQIADRLIATRSESMQINSMARKIKKCRKTKFLNRLELQYMGQNLHAD